MVVAFGGAESPEGDSLYAYPARESLLSPVGVAKIMQGAKPVRLAAEALLFSEEKWVKEFWGRICNRHDGGAESPQGDSLYGSPPGRSFCAYKRNQNTLGAVPQDPLTLKLRLDTNDVNIVRTAPQIRSQGACGAFYFGFCRD